MSTETASEAKNPLELSDEEFLKLNTPDAPVAQADPEPVGQVEVPVGEQTEQSAAADTQTAQESAAETVAAQEGGQDTLSGGEGNDTVSGADTGTAPEGAAGADPAGSQDKVGEGEKKAATPDYEAFYKQIMQPLKANGKTIELRSPEEAIQLMQMGANYTRKMQDIAPHRKVLTMLQNNNLLDEDRLSYLIDLDKKNPEAIKKLIKDAGIDPLEIDTSSDTAYEGGSHRVTDAEVNFQAAIEDVGSLDGGKDTLRIVESTWDQASKKVLWEHPETLAIIHNQRSVGIYDRIVAEVDRRKTLGAIPQGTPLIQAYKLVGDELTAANAFADLREQHSDNAPKEPNAPAGQPDNGQAPQPVATRVVTPKPEVKNGEAASAASPTRAAPAKAQEFVNPLAMADDEFLKTFSGRL